MHHYYTSRVARAAKWSPSFGLSQGCWDHRPHPVWLGLWRIVTVGSGVWWVMTIAELVPTSKSNFLNVLWSQATGLVHEGICFAHFTVANVSSVLGSSGLGISLPCSSASTMSLFFRFFSFFSFLCFFSFLFFFSKPSPSVSSRAPGESSSSMACSPCGERASSFGLSSMTTKAAPPKSSLAKIEPTDLLVSCSASLATGSRMSVSPPSSVCFSAFPFPSFLSFLDFLFFLSSLLPEASASRASPFPS